MPIPGIPKSEIIWLKRLAQNGDTYYITSKETRDCYYLYKMENNKAIKLGKAATPIELEKKYIK